MLVGFLHHIFQSVHFHINADINHNFIFNLFLYNVLINFIFSHFGFSKHQRKNKGKSQLLKVRNNFSSCDHHEGGQTTIVSFRFCYIIITSKI